MSLPMIDPSALLTTHPEAVPRPETLLEVKNLRLAFGGVVAVDGLNMNVHRGEIVSVIGPNGAGKTSAFNCITGFYRPDSGEIAFMGKSIIRTRPSKITRMGMARTFQNLRLFSDMSILDNVRTGAHAHLRQHWFDAFLHTPAYRKTERACEEDARYWLDFVGFTGDTLLYVTQLPYGEQRRVEIARALATNPKLLLLDEPAAGLNHTEKRGLVDLIRRVRDLDIAVVLIEHDMGLVMDISERIIVLNYGKEIADGAPDDIRANPLVIEAYLGAGDDEEPADGADQASADPGQPLPPAPPSLPEASATADRSDGGEARR
ncbi:MAG: ABC transporter ATP-binding protein [Propionibacteriaceae bacterium]|jgi:branched-chain amino acid transport system ATP-binding protein|nr:ABC transporter ATP-binding protein [Propionibacteriaceae bacterium]